MNRRDFIKLSGAGLAAAMGGLLIDMGNGLDEIVAYETILLQKQIFMGDIAYGSIWLHNLEPGDMVGLFAGEQIAQVYVGEAGVPDPMEIRVPLGSIPTEFTLRVLSLGMTPFEFKGLVGPNFESIGFGSNSEIMISVPRVQDQLYAPTN